MDDKIKRLLQRIAKDSFFESPFAEPNPQCLIAVEDICDAIVEIWELSPEEVGAVVNEGCDEENEGVAEV